MNTITQQIENIFQGYRMKPGQFDQYDQIGKQLLLEKIDGFVEKGNRLDFVMLGFPFKSTNIRDKVIGIKPDLAEEATLRNFAQFNRDIKSIYSPGVNISIASDGFVFNDLLGVSDNIVYDYGDISADIAKQVEAPMNWVNLGHFYNRNLSVGREKVMTQFAPSPEKLTQDILMNADINSLYRGMSRFMMEELADKGYPSGNQLQKAAKKLTREMMMRNEAWSNLVKNEFASHIRISMHPSINNGAKYSFQLIKGERAHFSAWHCAIYLDGVEYVTIHRKDAEASGFELVYKDGRPYNFSK